MITLLKCNACKKWSARQFKDIRTYTYICFFCGKSERVKNKNLPCLNLEKREVKTGLEASELVKKLNSE